MRERFRKFSRVIAGAMGSPWSFVLAVAAVVIWAVSGPIFKFSETWQLVINTGTTIVTFLMVFLIQNTQNRDSQAVQLKLDELIRAVDRARDELIDLEDCSDTELERFREEFSLESVRERGGQR